MFEIWDMIRRVLLTSAYVVFPVFFSFLGLEINEHHQMAFLLLLIVVSIAIQGYYQPYISLSSDFLAIVLQLILFLVVFAGLCLNISEYSNAAPPCPNYSLDPSACSIPVSSHYASKQWWQTFCFVSAICGYVVCGLSLIYEAYFGKMFAELAVHNSTQPEDKRLSKREWMKLYNARMEANIVNLTHHHHSDDSIQSTTKVVPVSGVEIVKISKSDGDDDADPDNSDIKSWE